MGKLGPLDIVVDTVWTRWHGVQKNKTGDTVKPSGHSGHSNFTKKQIMDYENYNRIREYVKNIHIRKSFPEFTVSTVSKSDNNPRVEVKKGDFRIFDGSKLPCPLPCPPCPQDSRTKNEDPLSRDPQLREAVKKVLNFLDLEANYGNFRTYDSIIDWKAFARSIDHPIRTAICRLKDRHDRLVCVDGVPVQIAEDIDACAEDQAREILAKQNKIFVKWW